MSEEGKMPTEIDLRYPIGEFSKPAAHDARAREERIRAIEEAPARVREAVAGLSASQLDTPYREGGWTVRQVVHHLPDSHVNAYVRFKLALTEQAPTIRTYREELWAQVPEARTGPVEISLDLLEALHVRWVASIRGLPGAAFERSLLHPDHGTMTVDDLLAMYAWHGRHHVAHIMGLRRRMGWS